MNMLLNVYIHLHPQEEYHTSSSEGTTKFTHLALANSQKIPTKIDKNGAIAKVRILVEKVILYYKAFKDRVISKEMPVLLLILC